MISFLAIQFFKENGKGYLNFGLFEVDKSGTMMAKKSGIGLWAGLRTMAGNELQVEGRDSQFHQVAERYSKPFAFRFSDGLFLLNNVHHQRRSG
jgi:hypothetical protein